MLNCAVVVALFAVRLRCTGVNPDDHRVKSEIVCIKIHCLLAYSFSLACFC